MVMGQIGEAPVLVFEGLALGLCVPLPAAHHQLAPAAGVLLHLVRPRHGHTRGDQRGPRHEHQHLASINHYHYHYVTSLTSSSTVMPP